MAPRRWAGARDELSGPAECCRQVASDAARGRRPRRGPRGAFPASRPPRARPGFLGLGPRPRERPAAPRPPPPSARLRPPYLAPPARLLPGGLHSKRPRTARPDPTQASQPESQPGGATVTKPAASARSAAAAAAAATTTGFPSSPGPRARPPPSWPMGAQPCGGTPSPPRRAGPPANCGRSRRGRRARGGGVSHGSAGRAGPAGEAARGSPDERAGRPTEGWAAGSWEGSVQIGEPVSSLEKGTPVFGNFLR